MVDDAWEIPRRRYARRGYRRVPGWLRPLAVRAIVALAGIQKQLGVAGPFCEIGVHVGRTFILLHLLSEPDETCAGFDRYELQNATAGARRKRELLANLAAHGGDVARVRVITADSSQLVAADLIDACGAAPRFVSLDAARDEAGMHHELAIAAGSLRAGGIVMLADYFSETWPEVSAGAARYIAGEKNLHPVLIGGNKFFLCNSAAHAHAYRGALAREFAGQLREARLFDEPVLVLRQLDWRARVAGNPAWRAIRQTRLGAWLRQYARPQR